MKEEKKANLFEHWAQKVTLATGSTPAILMAFILVMVWGATGPLFDYSETWQLVINTGTTIITFLMVFLIQKSQNRDSMAVQLKLNELIAAGESASNRLIDVEDLSEEELKKIRRYYEKIKDIAKKEGSLQKKHSVEEQEPNDGSKDTKANIRRTTGKTPKRQSGTKKKNALK
jgi:low affinity Fe/Cu permease